VEHLMTLETVDRTLHRKGTSIQEVLNLRNEDANKRFPVGLFTRGESRKFAFDQSEYLALEDEVDPAELERVEREAAEAKARKDLETQQELTLDSRSEERRVGKGGGAGSEAGGAARR